MVGHPFDVGLNVKIRGRLERGVPEQKLDFFVAKTAPTPSGREGGVAEIRCDRRVSDGHLVCEARRDLLSIDVLRPSQQTASRGSRKRCK